MSTKKKETPPSPGLNGAPNTAEPGSNAPPATGKGSRPRKAKVIGPQIYAVGKDGDKAAALVKAVTDNQAIEGVTGRYWARVVTAEEAVAIAVDNGISGILDATPSTTE